jgi:hypothetical protein
VAVVVVDAAAVVVVVLSCHSSIHQVC